jgi:small subunit ribosomal protein S8
MVTDPIADMLNQLMNAARVGKPQVVLPYSGAKAALAKVLNEQGYLKSYSKKTKHNRHFLALDVAYNEAGRPALSRVRRVSKPSRRIYEKAANLKSVRQGLGLSIVSTPKGLLTDREARKQKVGGEVLCQIW